jgi:NAD-dependent DNA ligase
VVAGESPGAKLTKAESLGTEILDEAGLLAVVR